MKDNVKKYLSKEVIKKAKGTRIVLKDEHVKYSKKQYAEVYKGYDFLGNLFVVRTYIQKYYEIEFDTLELFLKLMEMRIFTRKEYGDLPKRFTFSRFNTILDKGYIVVLSDHIDVEKRLFTLSVKARNIVINFYAYLSGEKKIPEDSRNNPMANKNKMVNFDKKKLDLIKKINQVPVPEHIEKLFKERK